MSGCSKKNKKETSSESANTKLCTSTMYSPIPSPATPSQDTNNKKSQSCPPGPTQGTSKDTLTPPAHQPGPLAATKKLTECLEQHFEENSTQVKTAIYHLTKNQTQEGACILEKVLKLNAMRQQQMAYHIQNVTLRSAALEQKVHGLQSRERFQLNSQVKMQQKIDTFDLAFDDDMEEPQQKKCKKMLL